MPTHGEHTPHGHQIRFRVYYEDTDAGGVVYHANYLRYAERARTDALRLAGLEQAALREERGLGFVVRRAEIDFLAPARLDDAITVTTRFKSHRRAGFTLQQVMEVGNVVVAKVEVVIVCIDAAFKPVALPDDVLEALKAYS